MGLAMQDAPRPSVPSEDRTVPFSQAEDIRAASMRVVADDASRADAVPLQQLLVDEQHRNEGVRSLIRPLTSRSMSPGNDNIRWLCLRAEVADENKHKVLAVTQSAHDIKFSVRVPGESWDDDLWCELYYDPASDNQILYNQSDVPLVVVPNADPGPNDRHTVNPSATRGLSPGSWIIKVNDTDVLEIRILERRPAALRLDASFDSSSDVPNSSGKRPSADDEPAGKRQRTAEWAGAEDDGMVVFSPAAASGSVILPLPHAKAPPPKRQLVAQGNPLLRDELDEAIDVPGVCELEEYTLVKHAKIHSTRLSDVFIASQSGVPGAPPEGTVTVKVLKTHLPASASREARAQDQERNVIRQAATWLRELKNHQLLNHESIPTLYGGDARYLSLYMERIDAHDLSASWRSKTDDAFRGNRTDAARVLRDMAAALNYLHGRDLVHNDIKPANILYSRDRGAVLCDFGLTTTIHADASRGGTPYYVPPEYIVTQKRGLPADMWALGVVMLYVLRKTPLPDGRSRAAHPRRLYWQIADLNGPAGRAASPAGQPSAADQMRLWLAEVSSLREALNRQDWLERLVHDMLSAQPAQRITAERLVKAMFERGLGD